MRPPKAAREEAQARQRLPPISSHMVVPIRRATRSVSNLAPQHPRLAGIPLSVATGHRGIDVGYATNPPANELQPAEYVQLLAQV